MTELSPREKVELLAVHLLVAAGKLGTERAVKALGQDKMAFNRGRKNALELAESIMQPRLKQRSIR